MLYLPVRIILTILAAVDILTDCYNSTIECDDGRIHIEIDIVTVILGVAVWFI